MPHPGNWLLINKKNLYEGLRLSLVMNNPHGLHTEVGVCFSEAMLEELHHASPQNRILIINIFLRLED